MCLTNSRAYQKIPWPSNLKFQRCIKLIYPCLTSLQTFMTKSIFSQNPLRRLILALRKTMHSKAIQLHNCKKNTMKHNKPIKEQNCIANSKNKNKNKPSRHDLKVDVQWHEGDLICGPNHGRLAQQHRCRKI